MTIGGAVGGIVGGIIGFFASGGNPVGAVIGFQIGMAFGSFIDPPKSDEQSQQFQAQDLQWNTFARNLPVPVAYGTLKVGGNIVWIGNTRTEIVERSSGGGKGSPDPPKSQEVWYWADFAVALSEGEIGGVSKVWLDEEDISDTEGISYTAYVGTSTQAVDSHVTTALADAAPVWRNLAYLLMSGRLGQANRLPLVSSKISGVLRTSGDAVAWAEVGTDVLPYTIKQHAAVEKDGVFYTIAGSIGGVASKKVYKSSDQGATWAEIGTNAFPVAQINHAAVVYDSKIWVSCGGAGTGRQIFVSADDCATWAEVGTDAFPHDLYDHTMLVFDSKMWIIGGLLWSGTPDRRVYHSTDGLAWTEAGTNALPAGRGKHGSAVLGGKMWVLGGSSTAKAYHSTDGVTWTEAGTNSLPAVLEDLGAFAHNNKLWVAGGSEPTFAGVRTYSSPDGITWTREGDLPTGLSDAQNACLVSALRAYVIGGDIYPPGGVSQKVMRTNVGAVTIGRNAARGVRDLLLNTRYGLGLDPAKVDDPSFGAAADYCDALVKNPDGTMEARFQLDYLVDTQQSVLDHLRNMLATFRGVLVWSQGTIKLKVEQDEAAAQSFDMNSIVADSFRWTRQSYRDRPNVVHVEYIDSTNDDYRHDFVEAFDDWDIDQTGERREATYRLIGVSRRTHAARMAHYYLDQAIHITNACAFRVGIGALAAEVADVVQVSHDVPGWAGKKFRILKVEEAENDELTLTCVEHNASIYHDFATAQDIGSPVPLNPYDVPWQVGRLSVHRRPQDGNIELSYTRMSTQDLFAGTMLYLRRGEIAQGRDFEILPYGFPFGGTAVAAGPTAYLDSQVRSVAQVATGTSALALWDGFTRADASSLGNDWLEVAPTGVWQVWSNTARRGAPGSGGAAGDALVVTSSHVWSGDGFVDAIVYDTSSHILQPYVGLVGRHQSLSGAGPLGGQAYVLEYTTKTLSHSIRELGIYRVTSGPVWALLSKSAVASGAYWSTPASASELRLEFSSYTLTGRINSANVVSAVDSWIQGGGEAGFARRGNMERYAEIVLADGPLHYWRLGDALGTTNLNDELGRAHLVNASSGATLGSSGLVVGDPDTAARFRGSWAGAITNAWSASPTFTIEAIVNIQSSQLATVVVAGWPGNAQLQVRSGMVLAMYAASSGTVWQGPATNSALLVGTAQHVAGTFDGTAVRAYVNGIEGNSSFTYAGSNFGANSGFWTGGFSGSAMLDTVLDEVAVYSGALASARLLSHYNAMVGSGSQLTLQGERWRNFAWGYSVNSPVLVRGLVHEWSARFFDPSSVLLAGAVASNGMASITLPTTTVPLHPMSGFLQIFSDQSYSAPAVGGRFPGSGFIAIRGGDGFDYRLLQGNMTAVQTFVPVFHALGGWANVGSARLRTEQIGYATFTDSRLASATRSAGGTSGIAHTNVVSLGAWVVETGGVGSATLLDLTDAAMDPLSHTAFFTAQSMRVFVGASSKFSRLSVSMIRNATQAISLAYRYSTGDGAWTSLTASGLFGPVDQTSGLLRSGDILVEPPGNWDTTNRTAVGGTWLGSYAVFTPLSRYYLEITRTSAPLSTAPLEMQVLLDGDAVVAARKPTAYVYEVNSGFDYGEHLYFKAVAVGIRGQAADGTQAPVADMFNW